MQTREYVGIGLVTALVGYSIYFDYQRRNNIEFRRSLAIQKKEAKKYNDLHMKSAVRQSNENQIEIPDDEIPTTNEGREKYFMNHLQLGEQLMVQGPPAYDAASTCFYRALQVYPEPQKLLEVLSQSLPEIIISMIIQKMAAEVQSQSHTHANVEEVE